MLSAFEASLRTVSGNPEMTVPYWDWTMDVGARDKIGMIWDPANMGGSGSPVPNGPFTPSQWVTTSPDDAFGIELRRNLGAYRDLRGNPVDFVSREAVLGLFRNAAFDRFCVALEGGPHNAMHLWVGGQMSSVPNSPNDPIFWLHHCNVDRIWAQWQEFFPNRPITAGDMGPGTLMPSAGPDLPGVTVGSLKTPYYDAFHQVDLAWSSAKDIAHTTTGSPALVVYNEKLWCFRQAARNSGRLEVCSSSDGVNWSSADDLHTGLSASPAAANYKNILYCIYQDSDDSGWTRRFAQDVDGLGYEGFIPDRSNAFGITDSPALAVYDDKLYYVHRGIGNERFAWSTVFDGSVWSTDFRIVANNGRHYVLSGTPALAVYNGLLYYAGDQDGDGYVSMGVCDAVSWSPLALIPNEMQPFRMTGHAALVSFGGYLYCLRQGSGHSGEMWLARFDGVNWYDTRLTDVVKDRISDSPVLAAFDGRLHLVFERAANSGLIYWATATPRLSLSSPFLTGSVTPPVQ